MLCVCGPVPREELGPKQILEQGVTNAIQSINSHCMCACARESRPYTTAMYQCVVLGVCRACSELPRVLALRCVECNTPSRYLLVVEVVVTCDPFVVVVSGFSTTLEVSEVRASL